MCLPLSSLKVSINIPVGKLDARNNKKYIILILNIQYPLRMSLPDKRLLYYEQPILLSLLRIYLNKKINCPLSR